LRLTELIGDDDGSARTDDIEIRGLTQDSRAVAPGFLFAALPGSRADGRAFIAEAIARGAAAILVPAGTQAPPAAGPVIHAENPRRRFAQLAARFYGRQPATIAAVTGTNGKTSVAWFLRQIWMTQGLPAACIGTLGLYGPGLSEPGSLTTPDPIALHQVLARLASSGIEHVAMEASSHGLDQFRLDGVRVNAAAFTNLTRDHLDYHRTVGAYLGAKMRLFAELLAEDGTAVVNADAEHAPAVLATLARRRIPALTFGRAGEALRLVATERQADGQRLSLRVFGEARSVVLPLVGDFQASNALAAAGLAIASGTTPATAITALAHLTPVPGRLERVAAFAGGGVYVDYAHTPDALATVLAALRPYCRGRLAVVFGCGGDRDPGKRAEMGAIAARLADRTIVTDDNPRSESAAAIRAAILAACPDATEIGDRRAAIAAALDAVAPGDIVLVAGKGHESGQIIGERVLPFDDRAVIRDLVRGRAA
jgi:UDP-N-acetylmuramoyl-L-alanyl-D-glutamate--2,6-diaminopimelate ligase